ncbi:VIT domain-containing protein [Nannocystis sp.]|uniref:VIT domain-containing protein n=1 Tax=Nannocystis sp. TaxID=1962667 RepID=UPI0025F9FD42|nr:VIT domain-containing protein [Nannocystis sp.]MBK7828147.1 VWA domain-containing protein [Nannocystis sp.]
MNSIPPPVPARRRSSRIWIVAGLLTLLAGGVTVAIVKPWQKPPPVRTERLGSSLELAAGEVLLERDGGTSRLLSGTPLPADAVVRTGAGARAMIRLGDGSRVFLRDGTRVTLGGGVTLTEGQLWLEAPPLEEGQEAAAHHVGEHTVSLSDGGASLSLQAGTAQIYVAEGLAIVSGSGGRAEVKAGEQAIVGADGAPKVEPVAFWEDWTGGMGDRGGGGVGAGVGSGALYAVDRSGPPGAPALPLTIQRQTVKIAVEGDLAETLVDQRFFNPASAPVEGWYWFTIPENSLLVSFALETNGQLVEGEIVERKKAAATYEAAIRRDNDPALLEWIDGRTVRARIYPVPALGERRIVLRYQQLLTESEGKLRYRYPLSGPPGRDAATIEEFSLEVQLRDGLEQRYTLATLGEARVEPDNKRVTMRRSGYTPRADFEIELTRKPEVPRTPLRYNLLDPGGDQARFVMVRYAPDLDFSKVAMPTGEVVVVVDTSAAGDPSEQQTKLAVAEALLRSLSAGDRFAVMSADVTATVLYPPEGLAEASPDAISQALEKVAQHAAGGATDLGAIFEQALTRVHGLEQPAVVYIGDGLATSGERGGDALAERLRRSMTGSRARLFTVGVGAEVDAAMLGRLARVGGGESLRVDAPEQAVVRALELSGALKTPTITDLEVELGEGLDDLFISTGGKLSRGQEMVVLARTHHDLPDSITVKGRLAGGSFEQKYPLVRDRGVLDQIVPRLWAHAFVERLLGDSRGVEAVRGKILSLGLEYGMMTPFTSFLALDSEGAYAQQNIQRRHRNFGGVKLTADSAWTRGAESRPGSVIAMLSAAASAPFGCNAGSAPTSADRSERRAESAPSPATNTTPTTTAAAPVGATPQTEKNLDAPAPPPAPEPEAAASPAEEARAPTDDAKVAEAPPLAKPSPGPSSGISRGADGDGGGGGYAKKASKAPSRPADPFSVADKEGSVLKTRPPVIINSGVARGLKLPCSDAAARGLAHRRLLWQKRLAEADSIYAALNAYEAAAGSCEVGGWKDQRVFLQLLHERVNTEGEIAVLLGHFAGENDARSYLARGLMRRLVDPALLAAVETAMFGGGVDWRDVDRQLLLVIEPGAADKRLAIVQQALLRSPGDPQGERRMIRLLTEQGKLEEAIARGRRLREQGLMTPILAQQIGEVFVAHNQPDQAQRVFSEIVEFDPRSPGSRRLLGDIFFRHHWFDRAYRQYEDLVEMTPDDALAIIRLARAAAGQGRTDEALRILRKVAAGEGRPGADDPRRFARLHAAVYLAGLLADNDGKTPIASVARELGRLQLFDAPAIWTVVVWDDLEARLTLSSDPPTPLAGDAIDAGTTGLFALQAPAGALTPMFVRHLGVPLDREVGYTRLTITWDGKEFKVERSPGSIAAGETGVPPAATPSP